MSKADMHKELIAKSKVKSSKQATSTGEEVEKKVELEESSAERKALERKKLVQDILRKEEEAVMPPSSSRQANERARRDFFADKDLGQAEAEVSKDEKRQSFDEEAKEEEVEEEKKPCPPSNSQDKRSCTIL